MLDFKVGTIHSRKSFGNYMNVSVQKSHVMLIIRSEQLAAMEAGVIVGFHQRIAKFFREEYSDDISALDDGALIARIRGAANKAFRYGIETERGIVYYTALDLLLGPDFDTIPEIADVLQCQQGTGDERIEALFEQIDADASGGT